MQNDVQDDYLMQNDLKCYLKLSDVHATSPYASRFDSKKLPGGHVANGKLTKEVQGKFERKLTKRPIRVTLRQGRWANS